MTMKRRLLGCLTVVLALMLLLCASAYAAEDPIKISMEVSESKFTAPKEIDISIKITNSGEDDMPSPVTLYFPDGEIIEEFGSPTLAGGASKTWTGKWTVTQEQLEAGGITFSLRYAILDDNDEIINKEKNFTWPIEYAGASASVEVNRTVTPSVAGKGQEVTVTYEIVNTGTVEVTDVAIKETNAVSSRRGSIKSIAPGEKATHTFTVKMGTRDITSQGTVTYKAGGKSYTVKKESFLIKYGEIKLTASLKADKKGGAPGDTVKLTLTLKNTGSVDYQNVRVTDPILGEVWAGKTVPAKDSVTLEKEITVTETATHQFTVSGQDTEGNEVTTASGTVEITAVAPEEKITLTLAASADKETVYTLPGIVKFKVAITNDSAVDVKNVKVYATGVLLYTFPEILAGETREFTRDVSVSMAGQYRFDATVVNQLDELETFSSDIIRIAYAQPTAVPTEVPIATPAKPTYVPEPTSDGLPDYVMTFQRVLQVIYYAALALALISAALLITGIVRRIQAKQQSDKAYDHLERGTYRDYSQPAEIGETEELPEAQPVQAAPVAVEEDAEVEETLRQLYPRTEQAFAKVDPTLTVEGDEPAAEEIPVTEEIPAADEAPIAEEAPAAPTFILTEEDAPAEDSADETSRRRRSDRHQ